MTRLSPNYPWNWQMQPGPPFQDIPVSLANGVRSVAVERIARSR